MGQARYWTAQAVKANQRQTENDLFHQKLFLFIPTEVLKKTSFSANLLAISRRNKSFRSILHIKKYIAVCKMSGSHNQQNTT